MALRRREIWFFVASVIVAALLVILAIVAPSPSSGSGEPTIGPSLVPNGEQAP